LSERRSAGQGFDEIVQSEKSPELKSGIGPVLGPRASVFGEAQAEPIDDIGDEFPPLFRVLEMQTQLLRVEWIIMEIETGLEIAADAIEPIAQAVFLSSLHRPSWVESPAIQQGREFDMRLRLIVASEPHPEIEVDAERILLHVDPADANNVDAGINDALNPVAPIPERDDMALLLFRSEIDAIGLID